MKIISISLLSWKEGSGSQQPLLLASVQELSSFGFFYRSQMKGIALFASREIAQRTKLGERHTINYEGYLCHAYVYPNGVACAVVTDIEYPQRVAFSVIQQSIDLFLKEHGLSFEAYSTDQDLQVPALQALIQKYQDPSNDPILKIQKDLDDTKQILVKSIDQILLNGEKLEVIAELSRDLSFQSKQFARNAEKINKCCKYI